MMNARKIINIIDEVDDVIKKEIVSSFSVDKDIDKHDDKDNKNGDN